MWLFSGRIIAIYTSAKKSNKTKVMRVSITLVAHKQNTSTPGNLFGPCDEKTKTADILLPQE